MKTKKKKEKKVNWKKECWKWFSIYIRLKYANFFGRVKCYTCDKVMWWKGNGAQAGHFQGGRTNSVLLDERGVRVQCYACNCGRSGEQYIFGKNLEKEIGEEAVMELKKKKHETVKVSPKEWEQYASHYQAEAVKLAVKKGLEIN